MSYAKTDIQSAHSPLHGRRAGAILSAGTLTGDDVCNSKGETLGSIQEIMLDTERGEISYAVLSSGGFLGMGDRLFAVPWSSLKLDAENKRFILDVSADRLKAAPGFDKSHWPDMADAAWATSIHSYYGTRSGPPRA
jgi:sporulation protein YlmC with PRC-barrel domain